MKTISIAILGMGLLTVLLLFGCLIPFQPSGNETNQTGNKTQVCPSLWQPVCGVDDKTYANLCVANVSGITIAYNGECIPPKKCTDSDAGKNVLETGTVEIDGSKNTDLCINSSVVKEFYCSNEQMTSENVSCPSGYKCEQGKCVLPPPPPPPPVCSDSDSGLDRLTAGSVDYQGKTYKDDCVTVYQVREYYCTANGTVSNTNLVCSSGYQCTNGKCIEMPQECSDTDGGRDKFTKGTATISKGYSTMSTNTDYCWNNDVVYEYYCGDGSNLNSESINCGTDYTCESGKCVYSSCSDSDGGQNLMTFGTASKGDVSQNDRCEDDYNLREYYCSNNNITYSISTCPSGYACTNGKCAAELQCSDSDNGQNLLLKGTTSKGTSSSTDICTSGNYTYSITEYFCQSNSIQSLTTACPPGYWCITGACSAEPTCTDSDGGQDYFVRGTVTKGTLSSDTDYCSNGLLVEYYCSNNQVAHITYNCSNSLAVCASGYCLIG